MFCGTSESSWSARPAVFYGNNNNKVKNVKPITVLINGRKIKIPVPGVVHKV